MEVTRPLEWWLLVASNVAVAALACWEAFR